MAHNSGSATWKRTAHTYDVQITDIDKYRCKRVHHYTVKREQSTYHPEWMWTVRGGGPLRDHVCDPDGKTHKRAVAAVEAMLATEGFPS